MTKSGILILFHFNLAFFGFTLELCISSSIDKDVNIFYDIIPARSMQNVKADADIIQDTVFFKQAHCFSARKLFIRTVGFKTKSLER